MERAVRMRIIKGMLAAFMTFSRIPVVGVRIDKEDMKYSMCFLPVIGIIIGLIQWLADAAFIWLGAGELMRVALMTAVPVLVTGGIHMDGFCDTTDAVSSYQTKERKLEILKDSNAGAFAVIYGVLWFVLYAGALSEIHTLVGIFACTYVISRAMAAMSVVNFRAARQDGMGAGEKKLVKECNLSRYDNMAAVKRWRNGKYQPAVRCCGNCCGSNSVLCIQFLYM